MKTVTFVGAAAALALTVAAVASAAHSQSMAPMEVTARSFGEQFIVKLDVRNPYADAKRFAIVAYDADGAPVSLWSSAPEFQLQPGALRRVTLSVPFDSGWRRQLLVCAETQAMTTETTRLLTQACARVIGERLG